MKKTGRCPKCGGGRIGFMGKLQDQIGGSDATRRLGSYVEVRQGQLVPIEAALEGYMCTDFGFFEEYVTNPQNLNWQQIPGFRWYSQPQPGGPYRG